MKGKLGPDEFVKLAIARLRLENYKGIHSVYSGFNDAFKSYFDGANPIDATGELARLGKIVLRPVKGGVMLYLPGDGPEMSRRDMALKKMGLLEKPCARPPVCVFRPGAPYFPVRRAHGALVTTQIPRGSRQS